MNTLDKLNDSSELLGNCWHEQAAEIDAWGDDWQMEIEEQGTRLVNAVARGEISIKELRIGVALANSLDREATQLLEDIDLAGLERGDRRELMARRLAHHSGRWALNQVKNESRRVIRASFAGRIHQRQMAGVGMGRLETHDMIDRAVVTGQTEVE